MAIARRRIGGMAAIVAAIFSVGCSRSGQGTGNAPRTDSGAVLVAGDASGVKWPLPSECQTCLVSVCGLLDSGARPADRCAADQTCFAAFGSFVTCFAMKPLKECALEVDAVKRAGDSGEALLACFMHACFPEGCELSRSGGDSGAH